MTTPGTRPVRRPRPVAQAAGAVALGFSSLLSACEYDSSPLGIAGSAPIGSITPIGLSVNEDFGTSGELTLAWIARDNEGRDILPRGVQTQITITEGPACLEVRTIGQRVREGSQRAIGTALLLDSSGSMFSNDPQRLRVPAAVSFAEVILTARAANRVGVFDFGTGRTGSFNATRELAPFTGDLEVVRTGAELTRSSGNTPLYRSTLETLEHLDREVPAGSADRILVVFSDGLPTSNIPSLAQVADRAVELGIPIFTVGLGPASASDSRNNPFAVDVMQELARRTGGVYGDLTGASQFVERFEAVATGLAQGSMETRVRLAPVPRPRDRVTLRVRARTGAEAVWVLQVPDRGGVAGPGCPAV